MKSKINQVYCSLFYLMMMEFRISTEIDKLDRFVNSEKILLFKNHCSHYFLECNIKIKYLFYVLELTYEYPEIEIYSKQLLEKFSIIELCSFYNDNDYTILHCMTSWSSKISFNSFEIIINFGINVNSQNKYGDTPLHLLRYGSIAHDKHYSFIC